MKCGTRTMLENLLWPLNVFIPNLLQVNKFDCTFCKTIIDTFFLRNVPHVF